jgi:Ca2+-binding RTX toxin-like protein
MAIVGDTDYVSASTTLAAGIANLTLTGLDPINGNGNSLNNKISGNDADNILQGYDGNDRLLGMGGGDRLFGGNGNDDLKGGSGHDYLVGGTGFDTLTGGGGPDKFVLSGPVAGSADRITDFSSASSDLGGKHDQLLVRGSDYGLPAGYLAPGRLSTSGLATSAPGVGQFVYDPLTHMLSWDGDGAGPHAGIAIASFDNILTLRASDFIVF